MRYLLEVSLFFWTAIFIEFVSTGRDGNLQQLSLMFAINILLFLVYFTFSFVFAFFSKNTRETYRGFYYTYFLMKRALIPIILVSFAYVSKEWQLSMLIAVQVFATCFEAIFKMETCPINRFYSILNNSVLILYLCLNFMFLNETSDNDDSNGTGLAIFTAAYIILSGVAISSYRAVTFILKLLDDKNKGLRNDNPDVSAEIPQEDQENRTNHPSNPINNKNVAEPQSPSGRKAESPDFNSGSKDSKNKEKTTPYNSSSQNRDRSESEESKRSSEQSNSKDSEESS